LARAALFGSVLARHGLKRELNGGDDYFHCWLEALEAMLDRLGHADPAAVEEVRAQWEAAYLATPHGAPVRLGADHEHAHHHDH
jgi:hypothetical protein